MQTRLKTAWRLIEKRLALRQQPKPELVYSSPTHFAREKLGFHPDPWQADVLESDSKRLLLNCCRQSGKSTVAAILALHQAVYVAGSLVLLISPSQRQSSELFKKVQDLLSRLPVRPALTEDNRLSLRLQNGSRVVSLPSSESNVRGFSGANLIVEDEASRVSDDLYLACRPMLAVSAGKIILMSTPWGRRGHFFESWEHGDGWERVRVEARQCPRISAAFLAEEQASMPAQWYASEYECSFVDTVDQVFSHEHVMGALDGAVEPLFPVAPLLSSPPLESALDETIVPLGRLQ